MLPQMSKNAVIHFTVIISVLCMDYFKATDTMSLVVFLQGQCHEMVVEVRPWSGRLALNYSKVHDPFFRLKIGRFKVTARLVAHPLM
jgi:hypothetical protein